MSISIDNTLFSSIRSHPGGILVLVETSSGTELAAAAVAAARGAIAALTDPDTAPDPGPKYVSGVLPTPAGPALFIDGGDTEPQVLRRIPHILVEHLQAAGVTDAVLTTPEPSLRMRSLHAVPRAAVLRGYGPLPTRRRRFSVVPPRWITVAETWLRDRCSPGGRTVALVYGAEFECDQAAVGELLDACRRARSSCTILHEHPRGDLAGISAEFLGGTIALGVAGETLSDDDLLEAFAHLRVLAHSFAPEAAHAFIDLASPLGRMTAAMMPTDWSLSGGAPPGSVEGLCDELLFDAYPLQILGPGHMARLGDLPDASPLKAEGRLELLFEPLAAWLPGASGGQALRTRARTALAPCLAAAGETAPLIARRYRPRSG